MNTILIFILRLILAMAFSVVLTRVFRPEQSLMFIAGLGTLLVVFVYLLEYLKKNDANRHGD